MSARARPISCQIRDVAAAIDEIGPTGEAASTEPLAAIADLLRLERAVSYSVALVDGRSRIHSGHAFRADSFLDRFDQFLSGAPRQFGAYDPARPEPAQRNRALTLRQLGSAATDTEMHRELYPRLGILGQSQLRVLVCEGPALLGWVGGWRDEPFSDEDAGALEALVQPLRRRLRVEAWSGREGLHLEAVRVAMDAIGAPAFLTRIDGTPLHANSSAREQLDRERVPTLERLKRAVAGHEPTVQVSPIVAPGAPKHFLLVLPPQAADARPRLEAASRRWALTPRQAEVLALVVRGEANKTIATTLGCSVRTVEVHVTALFEKAQCDSRSELGARFWSSR
jgi:DNA-binding CsgD family transcriptional regulator